MGVDDTDRAKPKHSDSGLRLTVIIFKMFSSYRTVNTVSVIKTNQSMLCREIIAVCSEIHTKHINTLCGQNVYLNIQLVPRSKHSVSVIKTIQLMLCREILAVCFETHTKHINTRCGQNVEFVNVKPGGTYSNHSGL
jgi:hypothetical protein